MKTSVRLLSFAFLLCLPPFSTRAAEPQALVIRAIQESATPGEMQAQVPSLKKGGLKDQQILESQLIFLLLRKPDPEYYNKLKEQIAKARASWDPSLALMFRDARQLDGFEAYMAALAKLDAGDEKGFAAAIKEAVWLDPSGPYIKKIQDYWLSKITVPMDTALTDVDGKKTTLAKLVQGKKALYLQVWATWCGPCIKLFPAMLARAKSLPPQGVAVAAINSELGRNGRRGGNASQAKAIQTGEHMESIPWLVEPENAPISALLELDSVPRTILLSPQGKILFNGHPLEEDLAAAFQKLGVKVNLAAGLEGMSLPRSMEKAE